MIKKKIGRLIAIEGVDGSGKSTLRDYLVDRLNERGTKAVGTYEVGGTPVGKELRSIAFTKRSDEIIDPTTRLLLVYAARLQHIRTLIEPSILNGLDVVTDRFNASTRVYQGSLDNQAALMNSIEAIAPLRVLGTRPDYVIYLKIDAETSVNRVKQRAVNDNDQYKGDIAKAARLVQYYDKEMEKQNLHLPNSVFTIDATRSIDQVKRDIDEFVHGFRLLKEKYAEFPSTLVSDR